MVDFSEAVRLGLTQAFSWKGRASRSEYRWFILFGIICYIPGIALTVEFEYPVIVLVWLFLVVPALGVFLRRMHDCGHSGWAWFWYLIPLAGLIVLLIFLCQRGDPKTNEYGRPPGTKVNW